jgi:multiple sugar transport system permease protein
MSPMQRREALYGVLFALPWILGFLMWTAGPVVASAILSFFRYDMITTPKFNGVDNYVKAFTGDDLFWSSLGRSFYFVLLSVPTGILGSLLLAWLLDQKIPGFKIFRALFYVPSLTPVVATAVLWRWLLHPQIGPVNLAIQAVLKIPGPQWLNSTEWAIPALVIMGLWAGLGSNRMLIFLAGLQGVPAELYEAAQIDGAGHWQRFLSVTLPMISPTIFFNLVLAIIGALQVFASAYVATGGGPARATWFFSLHIYQNAFRYYNMGYASALAWIFLVVILAFTWIQFRMQSYWVYYAGEAR